MLTWLQNTNRFARNLRLLLDMSENLVRMRSLHLQLVPCLAPEPCADWKHENSTRICIWWLSQSLTLCLAFTVSEKSQISPADIEHKQKTPATEKLTVSCHLWECVVVSKSFSSSLSVPGDRLRDDNLLWRSSSLCWVSCRSVSEHFPSLCIGLSSWGLKPTSSFESQGFW